MGKLTETNNILYLSNHEPDPKKRAIYQQMVEDYDPKLNNDKKISEFTPGSNEKITWKRDLTNPVTGETVTATWDAIIANRSRGNGCPYTTKDHARVLKGYNDIETLSMCEPGVTIYNGSMLTKEQIDIYKQMVADYDPKLNNGKEISEFMPGSRETITWKRDLISPVTGETVTATWDAKIAARSRGDGCPYTAKAYAQVLKGYNDIETLSMCEPGVTIYNGSTLTKEQIDIYKQMIADYDPNLNNDKKISEFTPGSNEKITWKRDLTNPATGNAITATWDAKIGHRSRGSDCPYTTKDHAQVLKGYNDIETLSMCEPGVTIHNGSTLTKEQIDIYKQMVKDYDPNLNNGKKISEFTPGSSEKITWKRYLINPINGKTVTATWDANIADRSKGRDCPYTSKTRARILKGYNDIETLSKCKPGVTIYNGSILTKEQIDIYKQMIADYDPNLNNDKKISEFTPGSDEKITWKRYLINPINGETVTATWDAKIATRSNGSDCPYTANLVLRGYNDIETLSMCEPGVTIHNGSTLTKEQIDIYKQMVKDYDPNLNNGKKISEFTPGSNETITWKRNHIDPITGETVTETWDATINNRSNGSDCPSIAASKGERIISDTLSKVQNAYSDIQFDAEKIISKQFLDNLPAEQRKQIDYLTEQISGKRFDFYIDKYINNYMNNYMLIEYDGMQHFKYTKHFHKTESDFENRKNADIAKTQFAKNLHYPLLRIPYETYDPVVNKTKIENVTAYYALTGCVPKDIIEWYSKNAGEMGKLYAQHAEEMNKDMIRNNGAGYIEHIQSVTSSLRKDSIISKFENCNEAERVDFFKDNKEHILNNIYNLNSPRKSLDIIIDMTKDENVLTMNELSSALERHMSKAQDILSTVEPTNTDITSQNFIGKDFLDEDYVPDVGTSNYIEEESIGIGDL